MCGIVAATASRNIVPVLIEGLTRLEYRGYHSAGIAVLNPTLTRLRSGQSFDGCLELLKHSLW